MQACIERVTVSAYMMTRPATFRAARPQVWISERGERRNPSLSASRIATSETSGRSSPSRSRLIPTSTSNSPHAQPADDLHPLDGVDIGMEVVDPHPQFAVVVGQLLGHPLGQGGDQHPLPLRHGLSYFMEQVVHLIGRRPHFDHRVDQAGRADDLLDHHAAAPAPVHNRPGWPRHKSSG